VSNSVDDAGARSASPCFLALPSDATSHDCKGRTRLATADDSHAPVVGFARPTRGLDRVYKTKSEVENELFKGRSEAGPSNWTAHGLVGESEQSVFPEYGLNQEDRW